MACFPVNVTAVYRIVMILILYPFPLRATETPLNIYSEPLASEKTIFKKVHFDCGKDEVRNQDRKILDRISEYLLKHPQYHLLIEGHCDERGSKELNMILGEQRALKVRTYLMTRGVKPGHLVVISYGKEKPLDSGHNKSAWKKNRRVRFLIAVDSSSEGRGLFLKGKSAIHIARNYMGRGFCAGQKRQEADVKS